MSFGARANHTTLQQTHTHSHTHTRDRERIVRLWRFCFFRSKIFNFIDITELLFNARRLRQHLIGFNSEMRKESGHQNQHDTQDTSPRRRAVPCDTQTVNTYMQSIASKLPRNETNEFSENVIFT